MSVKSLRIFVIISTVFVLIPVLSTKANQDIKAQLSAIMNEPNATGYLPKTGVILECINCSKLKLDRGKKTIFMLLWNIGDPNAAEFKAFANLFFAGFNNPKAQFLAINLDSLSKKKKVVAELLKNPTLSAQVIAAASGNKVLRNFRTLKIEKPTLAVITPSGKIQYIGSACRLEPQEILGQTSAVTEKAKEHERAILYRKKSIEVAEDEFNPQAEKLLENARMFFRIGGRMLAAKSYGQPIRMCRRIIKDYPNTKYADEARLLMRQVPERYHKRYKITDEELGL